MFWKLYTVVGNLNHHQELNAGFYAFSRIHLKYCTKTTNPADYLSRHPTSSSRKQQTMTEEHVNFVTRNSVPKAMTLEEVEAATNQDETMKGVRAAIKFVISIIKLVSLKSLSENIIVYALNEAQKYLQ